MNIFAQTPLTGDSLCSENDDSIREMKSNLIKAFPNITKPLTISSDQLNYIGQTLESEIATAQRNAAQELASESTRIDDLAAVGDHATAKESGLESEYPNNQIYALYFGSLAQARALDHWTICDGNNGTQDLRMDVIQNALTVGRGYLTMNEANALRPLSIVDVSNLHVMLYTGDLASAAPKASIKKGVHISGANTDYEYFTSESANAIIYVGQDAKLTATAVGKAALTINSQGGQAIIVNYGTITGTGDFGGLAVDPGQVNGQLVNYGTITGGVKNKAGELVLVDPNETVDFSTTLGTLAITRFDTPRFLIAGVPYELEAVTTGQATNYAWYANGAKAGSAIKSDPITFPAPGNHKVTLYAKNAKQMVTKTATIKVRQPTHSLTFEKGATGGNGTVYYAGPGTAGGEASPGNIGGYPFAYFRFYDPAANPVIPSATKPTISFPLIGPGDDVPFNTIWVVFKEHVWQFDRYDQNFFPIASQLEQVKKVLVAEAAGKKVSMILEGE